MRVLILGVTGMLGNAVFEEFASDPQHDVRGTVRSEDRISLFPATRRSRLIRGVDVLDDDVLIAKLGDFRPDAVINCTGLIKQLASAKNPVSVLPINSIFPHRLAALCGLIGARMVQLSSDCVFSGRKGNYSEADPSDADDLYGKSKYIGEVHDLPHVVTLRTSGIGHELDSTNGLLEWFLSRHGTVNGFSKAIYSGLTSVELARVIKDRVLPHPELRGLYHVSSSPISKLDLLCLIARVYSKETTIVPDATSVVDRSLNSRRFTEATGYVAPDWEELIAAMHDRRTLGRGIRSHV